MTEPGAVSAATSQSPQTGQSPAQTGQSNQSRSHKRLWLGMLGAVAVILVAAGGGAFAYASHYADLALPGTTISGIDVAGKNHAEIVSLLDERVAATTVNISGDVSAEPTLDDLGIKVNTAASADAVLADNTKIIDRLHALLPGHSRDVALVSSTDQTTLQQYANSLLPTEGVTPVNAAVKLNEETSRFEVSPAQAGTSLDTDDLLDSAKQALATLHSVDTKLNFVKVSPTITDQAAQAVADKANALVAQDITISSADGETAYTADQATKAAWISIKTTKSSQLKLNVDNSAISSWVSDQAASENKSPVTGKRNINSSGKVVATPVEAVDGQEVTNTADISNALETAFKTKAGYSGTFIAKTLPATWNESVIADGAEKLAYPAAPGEKWIDVNLTKKTITAYEGATVVHGPNSMVDGAAATPTVTGTFSVYLKYEKQTMRGQNADGTNYETEDVPWVSYFYSGYALHGAPWRSSFGYAGSHGCINLPVETARWYYNWDEIGTVVVSHR